MDRNTEQPYPTQSAEEVRHDPPPQYISSGYIMVPQAPPGTQSYPLGPPPPTGYQYQSYPVQTGQYSQPYPIPAGVIVVVPPPHIHNPDHNLTLYAVLALFCFWPAAIFAILKAREASTAWDCGDYTLAAANAATAWKLIWICLIIGIIGYVLLSVSITSMLWLMPTFDDLKDFNDDF